MVTSTYSLWVKFWAKFFFFFGETLLNFFVFCFFRLPPWEETYRLCLEPPLEIFWFPWVTAPTMWGCVLLQLHPEINIKGLAASIRQSHLSLSYYVNDLPLGRHLFLPGRWNPPHLLLRTGNKNNTASQVSLFGTNIIFDTPLFTVPFSRQIPKVPTLHCMEMKALSFGMFSSWSTRLLS